MSNHSGGEKENIIQLGKTGIVYEDVKEIEQSIFQKVYSRAFGLTRQIILSQSMTERKGENEQLDNIITFVGRRGTGKTSAMLSFMEFLRKNVRDYEETKEFAANYRIENARGHKVNFIALEWIDASLLEKGEDIFEYILAKMLRDVLDLDDEMRESGYQSYEIRELHQDFSSIYGKVLNLKNRSSQQADSDRMSISLLRDLARSSDLRREFEELIQRYLQLKLNREKRPGLKSVEDTYLVVAIDDMDMNVESGFEILEKIQRYLKVKSLIVLLAINHEQMRVCCEKHFSKMYDNIPINDTYLRKKSISRIAEEYMEKAIPSYMRIYLPSMKKKDYDRERLTKVEISLCGEEPAAMSIKEAIFRLCEQKTKVRYDSQGKKRHFMEPDTLRQLNNQYLFLKDMEDFKNDSEIDLEVMAQNIKRSMDDILFRFAFENLPQDEREHFMDFSEIDLRRRGKSIVNYFYEEISRKDQRALFFVNEPKEGEERSHLFTEEYNIYGYSYGELMRCLYFMGRESSICTKGLVRGILAMYTLTMTKIFYRYFLSDRESKERKKNFDMLKDILGDSAGGSWSLYFTPMDGELYTGAVKHVDFNNLSIKIDADIDTKLEKVINPESKTDRVKNVSDVVKAMESQIIMRFFFSNFTYLSSEKTVYDFEVRRPFQPLNERKNNADEVAAGEYSLQFSGFSADFSVINFINNIFMFEEVMDEFLHVILEKENVIQELKNSPDTADGFDLESVERGVIEEVKCILKEDTDSFYSKMCSWIDKTGGVVVPFYSTDIYYNMLKRLAKDGEIERSSEDYFEQLKRVLEKIENHLKESDKFYKKTEDNDYRFAKVFEECPFIIKIRNSDSDGKLKEIYNDMVSAVIKSNNHNRRLSKFKDLMLKYLE